MKQVSLECAASAEHHHGGRAEPDAAAEAAAWGIFFNQGEVCNAGSRLIVEESVKDAGWKGPEGAHPAAGDPLDPKTKMGAMVDETR
jgi:gamma-glutamyl-gamma-aminobutyraldehyde dehydrogenase/4-guanidinobutyraldehyde dehydrogenase/NAD-dependent aldehyde dehydrogenase